MSYLSLATALRRKVRCTCKGNTNARFQIKLPKAAFVKKEPLTFFVMRPQPASSMVEVPLELVGRLKLVTGATIKNAMKLHSEETDFDPAI